MICALSLVLVLAVSFGEMAEDLTEQGLTDDEKTEILAKHNKYRSEVQPPAANMLALQWNDEIAKMSQSWTNHCDLTLNGPSSTEWTACRLGRSVAFVHGAMHFLDFLDKWNNVTEDYNFEDNTCADICYRYTQMVRATTSFVGCGLANCFGGKLFYCMYGPSGDETQRPYESGLPCSSCPDSEGVTYSCENKLCTKD